MKTRGLSEIIWTVLKAMIRVLKAMFLKSSQSMKVREGYVKGNVKLFVGPYCFLGKLAVREGYVKGNAKVETQESKNRSP